LTKVSGGAMTTTPLQPHIKTAVDAGYLETSAARCGPLGLYTGELFLKLTDAGREKLASEENSSRA